MFNWFHKTPDDVQQFVRLLKKSRLLEVSEIDRHRKQFQRKTKSSGSARAFADYLVDQAALTRWQGDKLLDRKFKGFFLDEFLLLEHRRTDDERSHYAARNLKTNEMVILAVLAKSRVPDGDSSVHYDVLPFESE